MVAMAGALDGLIGFALGLVGVVMLAVSLAAGHTSSCWLAQPRRYLRDKRGWQTTTMWADDVPAWSPKV